MFSLDKPSSFSSKQNFSQHRNTLYQTVEFIFFFFLISQFRSSVIAEIIGPKVLEAIIRNCSLACYDIFTLPLCTDMASTLALSSLVIQVLAAAATSVYHPPTTHKPQIHQSSILCLFHVSRLQTHVVLLPPTTKDNLESASCCGAGARICVNVEGAKTSVSAWPGCQAAAALEIPPVLTRRAERLSAPLNHWLQRKSLSL